MRRHLGGDPDSGGFGPAHRGGRAGGREVSDVETGAGDLRECDVPLDGDELRRRRDPGKADLGGVGAFAHGALTGQFQRLAVFDHRQVVQPRVFEGSPHHRRIAHREAVIGDRHRAGLLEGAELGNPFPLHSLGGGGDRMDPGQASLFRELANVRGNGRAVVHRVGVRHACHRRETTGDRGCRSARYRLLVFESRLPEVDVHVAKPGRRHQSCHVHDAVPRFADPLTDGGDSSLDKPQVPDRVKPGYRIDNPGASQDHRTLSHRSCDSWDCCGRFPRAPPSGPPPRCAPGPRSPIAGRPRPRRRFRRPG